MHVMHSIRLNEIENYYQIIWKLYCIRKFNQPSISIAIFFSSSLTPPPPKHHLFHISLRINFFFLVCAFFPLFQINFWNRKTFPQFYGFLIAWLCARVCLFNLFSNNNSKQIKLKLYTISAINENRHFLFCCCFVYIVCLW